MEVPPSASNFFRQCKRVFESPLAKGLRGVGVQHNIALFICELKRARYLRRKRSLDGRIGKNVWICFFLGKFKPERFFQYGEPLKNDWRMLVTVPDDRIQPLVFLMVFMHGCCGHSMWSNEPRINCRAC